MHAAPRGENDALGRFHPGLRAAYRRLCALAAAGAQEDGVGRHEVGMIVASVMRRRAKYGAKALPQLAAALGTNVHTLYRCAAVAGCWSARELEALLRRVNARGQPLSWSHLVVLSQVPDRALRAELLGRALDDALSVRDLVVLVESRPHAAGRTLSMSVGFRVVRAAERWSREATALNNELLAELDGAPGDAASTELLDRAIAAQEQLRAVLEQRVRGLRAERARLMRGERQSAPRLVAGARGR